MLCSLMMRSGASHSLEMPVQAVIVTLAAILLFWNLTAKDLWQDEAATAVLASRMLKFGRPVAYDGVNLLTIDIYDDQDDATISRRTKDPKTAIDYYIQEGEFKRDYTWIWQPWGLFAIAAVSIKILGQTTLAARLPFALAGLATVPLLYRFVRKQFDSLPMAAISALLLVLNSYWILCARQCRYYSVSSLFLVLTLLAYAHWQWGGRGPAAFIAAAWCWFQVDYGTVLPVLAVLFLDSALANRRALWRTVRTGLILAVTLAPFVWFYELWHRAPKSEYTWNFRFRQDLFNMNEFVVLVLLVAAFLVARRWKSLADAERRMVAVTCGIIVAFTLWIPTVTYHSFIRYAVMVIPIGALLTAWVLVRISGPLLRLAWLAAALLVVTPWLSVPLRGIGLPPVFWRGNAAFRVELKQLATEVFGHPPDPNRLVIDWLRQHSTPSDEILINYEDIPLMYYLPNPIRGGIAAFRVEDDSIAPPRFLVLRQSVPFTHWPQYYREVLRYNWNILPLKVPDVIWGNSPDPMVTQPDAARNLIFAERVDAAGN
jgi:hypothetical protein